MIEEIIGEIYMIFRICLIASLLMFITMGIVRDKSRRTKGIVLLIVSISFVVIFTVTFLIDYLLELKYYVTRVYIYWIAAFVIWAIYPIMILVKSGKIPTTSKKKMIYTYHPKIEYMYVFYKYMGVIYLLKATNSGIKYKMKKVEFSDDAIKRINSDIIGSNESIDRNGTVTVKGDKTDDIYYCYMINLTVPLDDERFIEVSTFDIPNLNCLEFDKFVILNCLTKTDFNETF